MVREGTIDKKEIPVCPYSFLLTRTPPFYGVTHFYFDNCFYVYSRPRVYIYIWSFLWDSFLNEVCYLRNEYRGNGSIVKYYYPTPSTDTRTLIIHSQEVDTIQIGKLTPPTIPKHGCDFTVGLPEGKIWD